MSEKSNESQEKTAAYQQSRSDRCPACGGSGQQAVNGSLGISKASCGACHGTGSRGDSLSKVQGQPEFDLKK